MGTTLTAGRFPGSDAGAWVERSPHLKWGAAVAEREAGADTRGEPGKVGPPRASPAPACCSRGEQSPGWLHSQRTRATFLGFPPSDSSWEETDSLRWWSVSAGAAVSGQRKNTAPHSAVYLGSVLFLPLSVLGPAPHSLSYCSFLVSLSSPPYTSRVLPYSWPFVFPYKL